MNTQSVLSQRYKIEEHLASGGMADVYRARDLLLERTVAVKILRHELSSSSTFRERFRLEARSAANLSHPCIVTIHDFGLDNGKLFLVMEYVPGTDLKSILQAHGRFSEQEAMPLLLQACSGLGYAHRAGLIHCDVKPHNLIVSSDERLKITDFGIARALSSIDAEAPATVVWGSPQYFSPEQASGNYLSPASDVYSLGVVMYEMLTGHLPFIGSSAEELSTLHRTAQPPAPHQYNPAISDQMERIILKVLSKEPSARYRTADQLGRVLMAIHQPASIQTQLADITVQNLLKNTAPTSPPPAPHPTTNTSRNKPVINGVSLQPPTIDIDWLTWGMALLALIAVGGLIPLWLWIYLLYFPIKP